MPSSKPGLRVAPETEMPAAPEVNEEELKSNGIAATAEEEEQCHEPEPPATPAKPPPASAAQIVLAMVLYSLAASGMLIVNKLCMKQAKLPSLFSVIQFAAAAITVYVLSLIGKCPKADVRLKWSRVRPYQLYSFLFTAAIYSNLQALAYSSLATVIVFRSAVPLVVSVLDTVFLGRQLPNLRSTLALLGIAGATVGYVASDREFSMSGLAAYTWVTIYFVALSIEMVLAKHIVGPQLGFESIWGPVYHNNLLSIGTMIILMLLTNEEYEIAKASWTWELGVYVFLSCVVSVAISYTGWKCRSLISASSYTVLGVANKMLSVLVSSLIWDDGTSLVGSVFLFVCLIAACCYRQAPMRNADPDAPKQSLTTEIRNACMCRYAQLGEDEERRRAVLRYLCIAVGGGLLTIGAFIGGPVLLGRTSV